MGRSPVFKRENDGPAEVGEEIPENFLGAPIALQHIKRPRAVWSAFQS